MLSVIELEIINIPKHNQANIIDFDNTFYLLKYLLDKYKNYKDIKFITEGTTYIHVCEDENGSLIIATVDTESISEVIEVIQHNKLKESA